MKKLWNWIKENKYFSIAQLVFFLVAVTEGADFWLAGIAFVVFIYLRLCDTVQ